MCDPQVESDLFLCAVPLYLHIVRLAISTVELEAVACG